MLTLRDAVRHKQLCTERLCYNSFNCSWKSYL